MVRIFFLLFLYSPLFGASFFMEDQSVFVGIKIAEDRLFIKSYWIHKSEIKSQEQINSSGEVFQIELFDGSILTGTVERKDNYILIGSNPIFKDSKKIMKADIISMTEIKRTKIKTYLGYVVIGVIEEENDEVIYMTNIYNPEGYILKSKIQIESDVNYSIEDYTDRVKGRQHTRPWNQYSVYVLGSYTQFQDSNLKEYLPYSFGFNLGVIKGIDNWFNLKERKWYVPLIGSFILSQYLDTYTSYYFNISVIAGFYWKMKTFWRTTIHIGISPGIGYFRISDNITKNSINFIQVFSILTDIRIHKHYSLALRVDGFVIFESKIILYPYYSIGVKYDI